MIHEEEFSQMTIEQLMAETGGCYESIIELLKKFYGWTTNKNWGSFSWTTPPLYNHLILVNKYDMFHQPPPTFILSVYYI